MARGEVERSAGVPALLPGLAVAAGAALLAFAISLVAPEGPLLTAAVLLGALVGQLSLPGLLRPGIAFAFRALLAAGFAICGASAIGAVAGTVGAKDRQTAPAVAVVTLCGGLAIVVLPLLACRWGSMPSSSGTGLARVFTTWARSWRPPRLQGLPALPSRPSSS